jgi:hypothetical protein
MTEEERQAQPDEHPQDPAEGAEEIGDPAAETAGEQDDRESGGPTGGDGDADVQDSDEDAATPDGTV